MNSQDEPILRTPDAMDCISLVASGSSSSQEDLGATEAMPLGEPLLIDVTCLATNFDDVDTDSSGPVRGVEAIVHVVAKHAANTHRQFGTPPGVFGLQNGDTVQPLRQSLTKKSRPSKAKRANAKKTLEELVQRGLVTEFHQGGNQLERLRAAVGVRDGEASNKDAFIIKKLLSRSYEAQTAIPGISACPGYGHPETSSGFSFTTEMRCEAPAFVPGTCSLSIEVG